MKKKTAFTLAEVLVSLTVFATIFAVTLSLYRSINTYTFKQKEYSYIENICLDIDKVYDSYGASKWYSYYYSVNSEEEIITTIVEDTEVSTTYYNVYYSSDYKVLENSTNASYKLSYHYDSKNLIVDVTNISKDYKVIDSLNYGLSNLDKGGSK